MLLGAVSFVLGLLYLVNWSDDDIRRYTWKIISTTISIFLAVLLFQGVNQIVLMITTSIGLGETVVSFIQIGQCLLYIVIMQFSIAFISGAICEGHEHGLDEEVWVYNDPLSRLNGREIEKESYGKVRRPEARRSVVVNDIGMEVPVHKTKLKLEERVQMMKCYARLLAHMAGFAAINAGGTMQQLPWFRVNAWRSLIPTIIILIVILLVFKLLGMARDQMFKAAREQGRAGKRAKLYDAEVDEAENDISSLSVSFLIVQSIRYAVTGVLPNAEGEELAGGLHHYSCTLTLYGIGLLFALMACALVVALAKQGGHHEGETDNEAEEENFVERMTEIALNGAAMTFAWSVLWGTRWAFDWVFDSANEDRPHPSQVMQRVVIALVLSAVACASVFVLDKIDDVSKDQADGSNSEEQAKAIQILVNALAILIGFSWEHSFDGGVAAVASMAETKLQKASAKFGLGLAIAVVMTPMWRKHILTKEMALEQLKSDREASMAAKKKKEGQQNQPFLSASTTGHDA
jgi:heme/copper-type cytochrome/quinol oxidase subunit 2